MNTFLLFLSTSRPKQPLWVFITVSVALFAGFMLSILSWLELCVEHCSATLDYRLFGLPFAFVGIAFFAVICTFHVLSRSHSLFGQLVVGLIAVAFGSELMFILIQKTQIGHWCPVCLSIAASIGIAGLALLGNHLKNFYKGNNMINIKQVVIILGLMMMGFITSFFGVSKVDAAEASQAQIKDLLQFGNKNSPIVVYFFTDWYCPSCKKVEPVIEKAFPFLSTETNFYFVDYAIHQKSLNYTPYNLAFQIHNKPHYLEARRLLITLAEKNESPTDEDIIEAAHKKNIKFKELSFLEVKNGMEFFVKLVEKYNLNSTPILIITNKSGSKVIKLDGRDEITEKAIKEAIEKMKKS